MSRSPSRLLLPALALAAATGCRDLAPAAAASAAPPAAEFVLATGDSSYWVRSAGGAVHVRGAPIELARIGKRFYELYVAEDDRSFQEATFVGQRVYRRDLLRGDSALVYEDSTVPELAREYARRHPDDVPLRRDDEPSDDPRWNVVATVDLTDVHGPFASFDAHTDVEREGREPWHTSRLGVIDLRAGGAVGLAAVVGAAAVTDVERQRAALLRATVDSVRGTRGEPAARAAATLPAYRLDPGSFAITTVDGAPAVAYAVAGAGDGGAGQLLPLPPIRIGEPSWWPEVVATLPVGSSTGRRDVWRHGSYEVVVHYDSSLSAGRLALRDSTSREWTIARVPGPAARIYWLDAPPIDSAARGALERAFQESSLYGQELRTAALRSARRSPAVRLASLRTRRPRAMRPASHARHHA